MNKTREYHQEHGVPCKELRELFDTLCWAQRTEPGVEWSQADVDGNPLLRTGYPCPAWFPKPF